MYLERFTYIYLTVLFANYPHKYLLSQVLVMLYLLWCLKRMIIFTLHFTGLVTKFMLLMVLFHDWHTVEKETANHRAKRWMAAWGLTVVFRVSCSPARPTLFMMSKCFPCLFTKKHQTFHITMVFCSIQVAHTGRIKYLPLKAADAKAEQTCFDREVDWKHTWVNRILSLLQRCWKAHISMSFPLL